MIPNNLVFNTNTTLAYEKTVNYTEILRFITKIEHTNQYVINLVKSLILKSRILDFKSALGWQIISLTWLFCYYRNRRS